MEDLFKENIGETGMCDLVLYAVWNMEGFTIYNVALVKVLEGQMI